MKRLCSIIVLGFVVLLPLAAQTFTYPKSKTVDVVENYHGTLVADPYRWMENEEDPDLKAWIEEQNAITFGYVRSVPERDKIRQRLTALWNYPKYSVPFRRGSRYFFSKNDGLQNQSVVYVQEGLKGKPKVVIDPNALSPDGTVALTTQSYTRDGRLLAYGLSKSGSDWQEIRIRDIDTGKDYDEVIRWCKFASIGWTNDKKGFFYNRFRDPTTVPKGEESYHMKVYWHELGTPQSADKLVYERPDAKELGFSPIVTDDGKYLILYVWKGTDPENRIYYREVGSDTDFVRLLDKADASYAFIDNIGATFYFQTNLNAPKGRIVAIDIKNPDPKNWKEIIPEQPEPIAFVSIVNNQFVVTYMKDARHQVKLFSLDGKYIRQLELPTMGAISAFSGEREDKEMFFGFTSFLYPTTIFHYDFTAEKLNIFRSPEVAFDVNAYETKQVFCRSKDGTQVPIFLTHKKGITLDGNNPTILYGYGGFNVNITPSFAVWRLVWLEQGGIYASANLRGGSEYGEEWHKAGMLDKKQNVFDDFIAASEWLIQNNYTNSKRLAIYGASNGGLLVGACMLQRPDLFGAVICAVPVTDMLRYHKFTIGRFWVGEYGNAEENSEHFKFMYAYSPLHNIKKGVAYPPTLITTADHDDRVVPAHAMKFAATLQDADAGVNPILIRIETKAGHGGGKPTSKQIEEYADIMAFLVKTFGMSFAGAQ